MSIHLLYSYAWAQGVVEAFTEKYARGCNFLEKMLGIDHADLCFRLIVEVRSNNQLKWEASKRLIKSCQRETFAAYKHIPVKDRRKYLTICYTNCIDEELDANIAKKAIDTQSEFSYS